jgi:hypothetical protein
MYEMFHETEKVVNERVGKFERNMHMKEEENVRLKQILYGKEDVIRQVSIAYEQAKTDVEAYEDHIDFYKMKIQKYENETPDDLRADNMNLKAQNKQLLITLMSHLTKSKPRKSSKSKKSRFSGTLVSNSELRRRSGLDTSKRTLSKKKKASHRKHSSKRRHKRDIILNNLNSMLDYRNNASLSAMNKNLINIQNSQLVNNYQSFDSTLNKGRSGNIMSNAKNDDKENSDMYAESGHYHSVKTPQAEGHKKSNKRKHRPKTAVRREQDLNPREDLHSNSQHVPYEHLFGESGDMTPEEFEHHQREMQH